MRILLLLLCSVIFQTFGFSSTIKCSNTEYAGKQLDFYKITDPISGEKELVFSLNFDETGTCTVNVKTQQTIYTYCDFGMYRGMLYVEPEKTMELLLPPFREKSFTDQKNPYFTPLSFWFVTKSKKHLNDQIGKFEQHINFLSDKYFNQLYLRQSRAVFDSMTVELNKQFPPSRSASFQLHKNLKKKLIEADIFRLMPEQYSEIFDKIEPESWTHPAFIELFEKAFNKQLSFSAKAINGKEIYTAVQEEDTNTLLSLTKTKYGVSSPMAELVLLKLLHDGFYSQDFSQTAILNMIASSLYVHNSNANIKEAAVAVTAKFSFLQQGSAAPTICLLDLTGKKNCTDNNPKKFKYIVFADVETLVCQEHLKYLSRIDELFKTHLDIYIVHRDTDKEAIVKFYEDHQIPGTKMIDYQDQKSAEYKVRSFPQCFLLNEKHSVQFSHTKAPLDGFEQQFGSFLRTELFMRQRNQQR